MKRKFLILVLSIISICCTGLFLTSCDKVLDKSYVVKFKVDNVAYHEQKVESMAEVVTPTAPTKKGYSFDGWYIGETKVVEFVFLPDRDYDIVAKWAPVGYTITYDLNGGVNHPENPETYTIEQEISFKQPTKLGYAFKGWNIPNIEKGESGDKTIVADWEVITYTITYNLNGGVNNPLNPTTYTVEDNISLLPATKPSYECSWDKPLITKGTTGNLIITAEWNGINYNIIYNLNGGINNPLNPTTYTADDEITFKEPTKLGYKFTGWSIPYLSKGNSGAVTVTASWEVIKYTITYNLNGGENNPSNPTTYTVEDSVSFLPAYDKKGYYFANWSVSGITQGSIGNIVVDASYTPQNYMISYNLNGGFNNPLNPVTYTIEDNVKLQEPTKRGYAFKGWDVSEIPVGTTGLVAVNASWEVIIYNITYNLNGGVNHPENPTTYTIEDVVEFKSPTKNGYSFVSWDRPSITQGTLGDKEITAKFSVDGIYQKVNGGYTFSGLKNTNSTQAYILGEYEGFPVTSISETAFNDCYYLQEIVVSDSNPNYSSYNGGLYNKNKTEIIRVPLGLGGTYTIANTVTKIGDKAFENCSKITKVLVPDSIEYIYKHAFKGCNNLSYNIKSGLLFLGNTNNPYLTLIKNDSAYAVSYVIPKETKVIGAFALSCLYYLQEVIFESGSNLEYICQEGVSHCRVLKSIEIPKKVKIIGEGAFRDCYALETVTFSEDGELTTLELYAFMSCTSLKTLRLPASVTSVRGSSLRHCTSLENITVAEGNTQYASVDGVLYNVSKTWLMYFPNGKSGEFVVPSGVKVIADNAFCGADKVTKITLPNTVTWLRPMAFSYCTALEYLVFDGTIEQIEGIIIIDSLCLEQIIYGGTSSEWLSIQRDSVWVKTSSEFTVVCSDVILTNSEAM